MPRMRLPLVVKPRFGSQGQDVDLCPSRRALEEQLCALAFRPWFLTRGALAQELVPPQGYDLRLVVAGGRVVGAVRRVAKVGEWRTNVALGARREPVEPSSDAAELAIAAAAAAVEGALVGVDLLPLPHGGWTVLELNGAVDFTEAYAPGRDVFADTLESAVATTAEPSAAAAL
jgi:glutathione synthase/RimK-type ligase-like ATP-grasp enzyme